MSTGVAQLDSSQDYDSEWRPGWFNQKYKITNGTTTGASGQYIIGGALWGTYIWKGIGMTQWCTSPNLEPNLGLVGKHVKILYANTGDVSAPQSMPGTFANGDVSALIGLVNGETVVIPYVNWQGYTIFKVYGVGGIPGNIYTWDENGQDRGPGEV